MSIRDRLKTALEQRVLPGATKFARELYARIDPKLVPEFGIVVVPTPDVDWNGFGVGLPQPRADALLKDVRAAIEAAKQAHEKEVKERPGLAHFFIGTQPDYFFASKVIGERNEAVVGEDGLRWFSGDASHHFGFDLITMVGLSRECLERFPHVERGETKQVISLLRSVTNTFLRCVAGELSSTEALFRDFNIREDADDLLRDAGEDLVFDVLRTLDKNNRLLVFGRNVFEQINQIASLHYERGEGRGLLVLAKPDDETVPLVVRFTNPVPVADPVWARKMVELCTASIAVMSSHQDMFGLVRVGSYGARFCVEFVNSKTWRLRHDGGTAVTLMEVVRGVPRLPRPTVSRDKFACAMERVFPGRKANLDALWALVEGARNQAHGTMLVISGAAAAEAQRLASQATPISPTALDSARVESATRIDGSILVDLQGTCHAVGVILDGDATLRGIAARGARFNSALRYTTSTNRPASLAVVVSEDRYVDLLPRLRPQIERAELDALVELVRAHMEDDASQDVRTACCRLAYFYNDYIEDDAVSERASNVAFHARGFGSDEPIWGTFDKHPSDVYE